MARGVFTTGETQAEAERTIRENYPQLRILRSRPISLAGLPPLRNPGPLDNPWVVVVEHIDPDGEADLAQDEDPEGKVERETRRLYLDLATDPDALVTGRHEEFGCPACDSHVIVNLPAPRLVRFENSADCPDCGVRLVRPKGSLKWEAPALRVKRARRCAFCDNAGDSLEHAIPEWISKRLGIDAEIPAEVVFKKAVPRRRKQPIRFGTYRVPVMCDGCNKHFKHLEDAVIPVLEAMAKGALLAVGPETQELLALWASKTAIALLAAEDPDAVPKVHGEAVRAGRVPPGTWAGFFAWHGEPALSTSGAATTRTPEGRLATYAALLAFGRVGFCVFGIKAAPAVPRTLVGEPAPMRQFWPPLHRMIEWPPGPALDVDGMPGLQRFETVTAQGG